jgi:septin family protein
LLKNHATFLELEEDGVRIALTIVDTPGFGDNIDNDFAYVFERSARKTSFIYMSL